MSMTTAQPSLDDVGLQSRFRRFFYAEEVPYGLAIVRILIPLALLCVMLPRWVYAREIYSSDGAAAPLWIAYGYAKMLPIPSGILAVALHSSLIFFLVTSALGWCTRISLVCSTVLYTYLNLLDSISTMTKYSVIASHVLLILSVSQCGAIWSVDSWLCRRRQKNPPPGEPVRTLPASAVWPRRLMQILIGCIYFGSALTKIHTQGFFSSDQMQTWVLTRANFHNPVGEYMVLFPALLVIFAYIAIVWEVLFLFLSWNGWGRIFMLVIGAGFHVMTTLILGLYLFPIICLSTYFAFLNEGDVQRFTDLLQRLKRKFGSDPSRIQSGFQWWPLFQVPQAVQLPSPTLFTLSTLMVVVIGVELEHWNDPYDIRRPEGPYTLRELDPEFVEGTLLAPSEPMRNRDKVARIDIGTFLIGGVLGNRRTEFKQGENVIVQCVMNAGHEDMWVECSLRDDRDRVISSFSRPVAREMLRSNYYYELSEALEPGTYFMVINGAGEEVLRKQITLRLRSKISQADSKSPVAN